MATTMINARRVKVTAKYNNGDFSAATGTDIESITYVDSASDNSDSIDITINAQESKWLKGWFPEKGATIKPRIIGTNWNNTTGKGKHIIKCGLFVLDDISYKDGPSTLTIGGVSKPSNDNFSEYEREHVWKNTSIKRIGETIAKRYNLKFTYDADDHEIECEEQDDTDSSFFNSLCKDYGLTLKIYAKRMWVYDREKYKEKNPVKTFNRNNIIRGSLTYSTTLSGTFTGGYFSYTDADKDVDITCSVGGGSHTKNVSRRATSVHDASVQLCAEINNANHGKTKLKFSTQGEWKVCSGHVIKLTGFGSAKNGGLNGKYFVDRVTHSYSSSGFISDIECSAIEKSFHYWDVGGKIEVHEKKQESGGTYGTTHEMTTSAANASSEAADIVAGTIVSLDYAAFFPSATATQPTASKSGIYYIYDGILTSGRYRVAITKDRCGKLPISENSAGWVLASKCKVLSIPKADT